MHIEPFSDVVMIKRDPQQDMSKGGIIIPPSEDFTDDIGIVRYAGKGRISQLGVFIPNQVKAGMKVIFSTNGHQLTKIYGEELIVCREPSVMCIIEGDDVHSYASEQVGT